MFRKLRTFYYKFYPNTKPRILTKKSQVLLNPIASQADTSKLNDFINKINYPIHYIDFEAFHHTKTSQQLQIKNVLPFLCALGRQNHAQAKPNYYHHMLKPIQFNNPSHNLQQNIREQAQLMAKFITDNVDLEGSILAYGASMEIDILDNLMHLEPEYASELTHIKSRVIDVQDVFNQQLIKTGTSSSLKKVVAALKLDIQYESLPISDGIRAKSTFFNLATKSQKRQQYLIKELIDYCHTDVKAIHRIIEHINKLIANESAPQPARKKRKVVYVKTNILQQPINQPLSNAQLPSPLALANKMGELHNPYSMDIPLPPPFIEPEAAIQSRAATKELLAIAENSKSIRNSPGRHTEERSDEGSPGCSSEIDFELSATARRSLTSFEMTWGVTSIPIPNPGKPALHSKRNDELQIVNLSIHDLLAANKTKNNQINTPKPATISHLLFTNNQFNFDFISALINSEANHGLKPECCIVYVMEKHNINEAIQRFVKHKSRPRILFIIDNFGVNSGAKRDLHDKTKIFIKHGFQVKLNAPNYLDTEQAQTITDLQHQKRTYGINSYVARLIRNAVTIHPLSLLLKFGSLKSIIEKYRTVGSIFSQSHHKHNENNANKVADAISHFKQAHPLTAQSITADDYAATVSKYFNRRGLELKFITNGNVRYAPMSYQGSKKLHPTIVLAYGRRWECNTDNYFEQPITTAINDYPSFLNFSIIINKTHGLISAEERLPHEIILTLADGFENINIHLDHNHKISAVFLNMQPVLAIDNIKINSCTFSHRIYLKQGIGRKLKLTDLNTHAIKSGMFNGKDRFRAKRNRGVSAGAFFIAHIEGKATTIFIVEGPEEAWTIRDLILKSAKVRGHYGIEHGNYAIIATTTLPEHINFPQEAKHLVFVIDNDGDSLIYQEKNKTLSLLSTRYKVYVVMASTQCIGKKCDFNDILVHYGLAALEKAFCRKVTYSKKLFSQKHNNAELAIDYALIAQSPIISPARQLLLAITAYRNKMYAEALQHVDQGLTATNDSQLTFEFLFRKSLILNKQNNLPASLSVLERARYDYAINTKDQIMLDHSLGDTQLLLGNKEWALMYYERALAEVKNDLYQKAILLHKIGLINKEIAYFEASESIWELIDAQRTIEEFWFIPNQAYKSMKAANYYAKCKLSWAITIAHKAQYFLEIKDPDKAIDLYLRANRMISNVLGTNNEANIKLHKQIADIKNKQKRKSAINDYITCVKMIHVLKGTNQASMAPAYQSLIAEITSTIAALIKKYYLNQSMAKWEMVCNELGLKKADREQIAHRFFSSKQQQKDQVLDNEKINHCL